MVDVLRFVVGLVADVMRRAGLVAENALLRQQLIVAQRKIAGRVRWAPGQRFTMGVAARMATAWRDATLLVQPGDHPPLAPGRLSRVLAPTLAAVGSTPYGTCGAHSRDGQKQSALGAERLRGELLELGICVQENRPAVHAARETPRRRAKLGDLSAESRRVGARLCADLRHPVP